MNKKLIIMACSLVVLSGCANNTTTEVTTIETASDTSIETTVETKVETTETITSAEETTASEDTAIEEAVTVDLDDEVLEDIYESVEIINDDNETSFVDRQAESDYWTEQQIQEQLGTEYDLNNYMQRIEDGAIMYEGRLDVKHNKPEIARFKMEKGKIVEIPLDEKVELPNVAEKTKKAIKSFVKAFEIVGSEVKDIVLFKDKEHKVKKCKIKRKLEEKILKQYNEEKNVKMYDITKDDKNYTVYLCDDVVIDGKRLAEAFVCGNKFVEEPLKKVYVEAGKEKILKEKSMAKFFEKGIDFSSSKDEYIGEPQISSEGITIKKDEEFSKHFIGKQMATEIADKNHTEYITSKNKRKIGIDFFKKIYEKVSERNRNYARNIIKRFKEKDTSKERNTQTKEMEER